MQKFESGQQVDVVLWCRNIPTTYRATVLRSHRRAHWWHLSIHHTNASMAVPELSMRGKLREEARQ